MTMKTRFLALLLIFLPPISLYCQDINNTLGSGGAFTIKYASTTFLSLTQSDGYLNLLRSINLPATTSSNTGVIFKGTFRFIHDYQASGSNGYNTFVGLNSGNFTLSGTGTNASYNTGVGRSSLASLSSGSYDAAFGTLSLANNSSGSYNSSFGSYSMNNNSTGNSNSAFGSYSLYYNSSGSSNAAFGVNALLSNTTGSSSSAFGYVSLQNNTTGSSNSAFGYQSLSTNTTGGSNSAFGWSALQQNSTGSNNSAYGSSSLYNNSIGGWNSAFGTGSLQFNTSGNSSSAFGYQSLNANTTGSNNSALGKNALLTNTTGNSNSAFGYRSLESNSNGNYNSGFGYLAGIDITTGSNVTCVGYDAQPTSSSATNEVTLGNGQVTQLRCNVQTITSLSDARDKKNIRDINLGMNFLMTLKPRIFNWDRREWYNDKIADGSKMNQTPTAGFIAQELDEAQKSANAEWLNLVLKSNPDRLEATPGNLLPIMVRAIQELNFENNALRNELIVLRASISEEVKKEVKTALLRSVHEEEAKR